MCYNVVSDATGKWRYLSAFDVNARDARGHTALYAACALGDLPVVSALLDHIVPTVAESPGGGDRELAEGERVLGGGERVPGGGERVAGEEKRGAGAGAPVQRGGFALGIHAIVSRLRGAPAQQQQREQHQQREGVRPVRTELCCAGDTCVGVATRAGHVHVLRRLLAAGADPDALSLPPADLVSTISHFITFINSSIFS